MDLETRMSVRRSLMPIALLAGVAAAAGCSDTSPLGVQTPTLLAARSNKTSGLVACSQGYDSVTKLVGPRGDTLHVGHHILAVHSLALADTVRITAVAPAGSTRWVRFSPDGLVFQPTTDGWSAVLYTDYKDCGVPSTSTPRLAQVSNTMGILQYLPTYVQSKKNAWSQANQYVIGLLQHFSNYAVAW
jgi:hypothetical protein